MSNTHLAAFALLALAACGRVASTAHSSTSPAASASASAQTREPLGARLAYAVPSCPLRYEVLTREQTQMDGAGAPAGLDTFITLEGKAEGHRFDLTGAMQAIVREGQLRPFSIPDSSFAPVHLTTDGTRWSETDGPTMFFLGLGTQLGIGLMFPDLPPSTAIGSTTEWTLALRDAVAVARTEAARGHHPGLAPPPLDAPPSDPAKNPPIHAQVRVDGWSEEQGVLAAHLSMTASYAIDQTQSFGGEDMTTRGHSDFEGTYVVLATGRILRGVVERKTKVDLISGQMVQHHTMSMHMEMHLVNACDGPTAPTLVAPRTRDERAIDAAGNFVVAVMAHERDKAVARFSPAMRKKYGDDALWKALTHVTIVYGDRALSPPVFLRDDDVVRDGEQLRLRLHGGALLDGANTPLATKIVMSETAEGFVIDSLRGVLTIDDAEAFEMNLARMIVNEAPPPKKIRTRK